MVKPRHLAIKLPNLDIMAIEYLLSLLQSVGVVRAFKLHGSVKMAIRTYNVYAVVNHATLLASESFFRL
jgi:hypothetical protein